MCAHVFMSLTKKSGPHMFEDTVGLGLRKALCQLDVPQDMKTRVVCVCVCVVLFRIIHETYFR